MFLNIYIVVLYVGNGMGKPQTLVSKKIELLPIERSQNKMYSNKLLAVLDKRVRKDPALLVFYRNGRVVAMDVSDGISRLKGMVAANRKKRTWDRFAIYTLANRAFLNDVQALATRIAMDDRIALKNFAKAKNTTEDVKRDINKWATGEVRSIDRSLTPLTRKYKKSVARLDVQEARLRKGFSKRIEKARDAARQKKLRAERDRRIEKLKVQRRKLGPLRESILKLQALESTFDDVKF